MEIAYWHWLILGILLIAAEMVVPGTWLLWPGLAGLLTGMVAYMAPSLGWEAEAILFTVLAVAFAVAGRRLYARLLKPTDEPALNRRGQQHVGTVHTLDAPILDGAGRMKLGDSTWKIIGPDLPAGTKVRVVAVEGIVLRVERAE